jgi:hypothetical protein
MPNAEVRTERTEQEVSKAIYAGWCSLQGCLFVGFVFLHGPMGARRIWSDTLSLAPLPHRCAFSAVEGLAAVGHSCNMGTRAAQRLVREVCGEVSMGQYRQNGCLYYVVQWKRRLLNWRCAIA